MNKELKKYIKQNLKFNKKNKYLYSIIQILLYPLFLTKKFKNILFEEDCYEEFELKEENKKIIDDYISDRNINLDNYITANKQYNNFQTLLFKMIDERNLIDSDVYNKVHIDRRLFSKIRNDKNYHPSKETVILLGLSLELSENEIEKLLESASYSLPRNNHYDLIIRFCFMKGIYKLTEVNDLLNQYKCKLFNY